MKAATCRVFTRPEIAEILRDHCRWGRAARCRAARPRLHRLNRPQAGKSGARALRRELGEERKVEILDGDEVRTYLSKGLGFSKEDRDTNIRRIGYVARLLARNGTVAIGAAISPYAEIRDEVRRLAEQDGVPFVEVYAEASLESLTARDVKGLYKKAIAGEIQPFTGVSDPYEPPTAAEVVVKTDKEPVAESLGRILVALEERGLLEPEPLEAAS